MDILERILQLRQQRNWTEYQLSMLSGIPQSTISSWYNKKILPSLVSLEKICHGFGITMSQFFSDPKDFLDLTEEQKKVLSSWNCLSETEKKLVYIFIRYIR